MTTPMGELEPELEGGITYLQDNEPELSRLHCAAWLPSASSNGERLTQHSGSMVRRRSARRSTGWSRRLCVGIE